MKNRMRISHHPPHVDRRMSSWLLFSTIPGNSQNRLREKKICGRSPRPDVDAAYTPMLEINSNPMDQYRVSGVFCGINELNSFPPSTQIQKGQKGMSPTADQSSWPQFRCFVPEGEVIELPELTTESQFQCSTKTSFHASFPCDSKLLLQLQPPQQLWMPCIITGMLVMRQLGLLSPGPYICCYLDFSFNFCCFVMK